MSTVFFLPSHILSFFAACLDSPLLPHTSAAWGWEIALIDLLKPSAILTTISYFDRSNPSSNCGATGAVIIIYPNIHVSADWIYFIIIFFTTRSGCYICLYNTGYNTIALWNTKIFQTRFDLWKTCLFRSIPDGFLKTDIFLYHSLCFICLCVCSLCVLPLQQSMINISGKCHSSSRPVYPLLSTSKIWDKQPAMLQKRTRPCTAAPLWVQWWYMLCGTGQLLS